MRRTCCFLSQYDPELGEVAAFEELIGSHGGLGGPQTAAVHPPSGRVDARRGGPARRAGGLPQHPAWLGSIGIELGRPEATATATADVPLTGVDGADPQVVAAQP